MKILLLTTGGTITSQNSSEGLKPNKSSIILDFLKSIDINTTFDYHELFTLDSSNMQPEEWQMLAEKIYEFSQIYDGIIVTHGTDTLAYTTSMLCYMVQNPRIPIVFTGSQLPIYNILTDAYSNLRYALAMAKSKERGIYVAFNRKIILGCRAVKVRTTSFFAFESINQKYAGQIDSKGLILDYNIIYKNNKDLILNTNIETNIFLLKLTPTTSPNFIDILIKNGIKGIVIEAYGAGGISFIRRNYIEYIKKATSNNIPICVCSQCLYEESNFNVYEVGKRLLDAGIIEALDMTTEACVTKLMYALGNTTNLDEIRRIFKTNISGEINFKDEKNL